MSRIGKSPIKLPKGIKANIKDNKIFIEGPHGKMDLNLKEGINLEVKDGEILVTLSEKSKLESSFHGLYRALINNMVVGVNTGFKKELVLIGVGYRAQLKGNKIDFQLGFSHPTEMDIPKGLKVNINKSVEIEIIGVDKQVVGEFAAKIRSLKPPEPYKGKGIRYKDEYVRKKDGKAAKAAATK